MERVSFPNYENFDNPDFAYSDFITLLHCVIDSITPFKTFIVKNNTIEWFDGEIAEKIHTQGKLYKRFKSARLLVDNIMCNTVKKLIRKKKQVFFEEKIK